jgi:hypothetical protein
VCDRPAAAEVAQAEGVMTIDKDALMPFAHLLPLSATPLYRTGQVG